MYHKVCVTYFGKKSSECQNIYVISKVLLNVSVGFQKWKKAILTEVTQDFMAYSRLLTSILFWKYW